MSIIRKHHNFLCITLLIICSGTAQAKQHLVLEATPSQGSQGRIIDQEFESALSKLVVATIHSAVSKNGLCTCSLLVSSTMSFYERITAINQRVPTIFIALRCYERGAHDAPSVQLYHYARNIFSDALPNAYCSSTFIALEDVYKTWFKSSQNFAMSLSKNLQAAVPVVTLVAPVGLPLRPLEGVNACGMLIEIGIKDRAETLHVADLIAQALLICLKNLEQEAL